MGLFKKKKDAFTEKEKEIQKQLSAIKQEIQQLHQDDPAQGPPAKPLSVTGTLPPQEDSAIPSYGDRPPRLRSTARPGGSRPHVVVEPSVDKPIELADPIFEEVHQKNPFQAATDADPEQDQAMGLRQNDFGYYWERFWNHFRSRTTTNPKLVNYLAAGSIQGLRPLRYEKRVARNRFIALASILVILLWGILALILKR